MGDDVIIRELTEAEIAQVPGVNSKIVFSLGAVDDDGKVAAALPIFIVVHADPLWVREDHRNSPRLLPRLWEATKAEIVKRGGNHIQVGMTDIEPGEPVETLVARMCEFAGGYEIKARFFVIPIEAPDG